MKTRTDMSKEKQSDALPEWMNFPTLAEVFEQSPSKAIAYLTEKHNEYQALEALGTATNQIRARLISASYARTCALLQELEAKQAELLGKQSTELAKVR